MTQDKSLKDEPQVLLGHPEFWCLVAVFSDRTTRKACCQSVVGFTRISVVQPNLQTQWNHITFFTCFFSEAILNEVLSERLRKMGGFWARVGRVAV